VYVGILVALRIDAWNNQRWAPIVRGIVSTVAAIVMIIARRILQKMGMGPSFDVGPVIFVEPMIIAVGMLVIRNALVVVATKKRKFECSNEANVGQCASFMLCFVNPF